MPKSHCLNYWQYQCIHAFSWRYFFSRNGFWLGYELFWFGMFDWVGIAGNSVANSAAENAATQSSSANNRGEGTTSTPARRTYDTPHLWNRPPVSDSLVSYSGIVSCRDHLGMVAWGGVVLLERLRERMRESQREEGDHRTFEEEKGLLKKYRVIWQLKLNFKKSMEK